MFTNFTHMRSINPTCLSTVAVFPVYGKDVYLQGALQRLNNLPGLPGGPMNLSFTYFKTFEEIKEKAAAKITAITAKIQERQARVLATRKNYEIDDAAMADLFRQARSRDNCTNNGTLSYVSSMAVSGGDAYGRQHIAEQRTVGIGVIQSLLAEHDAMDNERSEIQNLEFIVRNLRPYPGVHKHVTSKLEIVEVTGVELSESQLRYLGF